MENHKWYVNAYWVQSILGLGKLIILGSLFSLRVFLKVPWYRGTLNVWWPAHLPYQILKRVSQEKKWKIKTYQVVKKLQYKWSIVVECYYKVRWYGKTQVSALPTTTTTNPHGCSCNNMFSIHHRRPLISNVMSTPLPLNPYMNIVARQWHEALKKNLFWWRRV